MRRLRKHPNDLRERRGRESDGPDGERRILVLSLTCLLYGHKARETEKQRRKRRHYFGQREERHVGQKEERTEAT